jgi:hypothetical protein
MHRRLLLAIIPALCLGLSGPAPRSGPKMLLVINFDVEDYITPESEGIDDIPKWLAETLTEEGARGTFYVIGEKARSLERRGRRDVIEAMARHDIGSHTNFGSIHPTVTEQLEKADWDGGVRLMTAQESAGIKELGRIFGRPVRTLARHGGSYGPQLVCALGKMNVGYTSMTVLMTPTTGMTCSGRTSRSSRRTCRGWRRLMRSFRFSPGIPAKSAPRSSGT